MKIASRLIMLLLAPALLLSGCIGGLRASVPKYPTAQDQYANAYQLKSEVDEGISRGNLLSGEEQLKEYEKLIPHFEAVIERFPNEAYYVAVSHLSIGDIGLKLKKWSEAEEHFAAIEDMDIDDEDILARSLLGHGISLRRVGRPEEARLKLQKCIDMYQNSSQDHVLRYVELCRRELVKMQGRL